MSDNQYRLRMPTVSDNVIMALEVEVKRLRAERDALIPVVEAAIAFVDGSASLGPVVAATRAWRAKRTEGAQP